MSNKFKHLDYISAVISRMSQNSFTIRGWTITVVTALVAFGVQATDPKIVACSLIPIVIFWIMDAYYLRQEQAFRSLFDDVKALSDDDIDFNMVPIYKRGLFATMFNSSLFFLLYFGLGMVTTSVALVIWTGNGVADR